MEIKSVKQLSLELKEKLETDFAFVWVKGEITQIKTHVSGHVYFCLKEEEYIINGIIWKNTPISCSVEDGIVVECYGKITVYPSRSSYQIIVKEVKKVNQLGNILLELEKLKKKLQAEGLFAIENKKKVKKINEKIAIITSPTGAVFHDMMHRINNRFPCCEIFFYSVNVQGTSAIPEIIKALKAADEANYDVIILARGGGSLEDLWIFNDEQLTRTVAAMQTPIITAIGHETDTTLVDFASSLRAPTPTAAAEFITMDKLEIQNMLQVDLQFLKNQISNKLKHMMQSLKIMNNNFDLYNSKLNNFAQKLDYINMQFIEKIQLRLEKLTLKLNNFDFAKIVYSNFENKTKFNYAMFKNFVQNKLQLHENFLKNVAQQIEEDKKQAKNKLIVKVKNKKINSIHEIESEFSIQNIEGEIFAKRITDCKKS